MIINKNREPRFSLIYIGALIIQVMKEYSCSEITNIFEYVRTLYNGELSIDYFYYGMDWLFLLKKVKFENGEIILCE